MHVQTTLMDVIAGRKTQGEIRGEIHVNGFPKVQETWARVVGYVEQMDIHSPQVGQKMGCKTYTLATGSCDWLMMMYGS